MPRYKLTIAYDGTHFHGWQRQLVLAPPGNVARPAPVDPEASFDPETPPDPGERPTADDAGTRAELRTVQSVLTRAVRQVVREPVILKGASRTDSGVHARGQVAAFTCGPGTPDEDAASDPEAPGSAGSSRSAGWPVARGVDRLVRAINGRLPDDVLVLAAEPVPDAFDPIGHCTGKGYSYTLHVSSVRPLWDRAYVHHVWERLDVGAMRAAAAAFVGEHDFAGFAAAGHGRQTTVRRVFDCRVVELGRDAEPGSPGEGVIASVVRGAHRADPRPDHAGPGSAGALHGGGLARDLPAPDWACRVRIEIAGNGFLWNMVRIVAGTLVDVGRGRIAPDAVPAIIASGDRRRAGPTLPACGLCLEWVGYAGV